MEGVFLFRSWFLNAPGQVLFARVNAEQCTEFQSSKKKRVKHLGKNIHTLNWQNLQIPSASTMWKADRSANNAFYFYSRGNDTTWFVKLIKTAIQIFFLDAEC